MIEALQLVCVGFIAGFAVGCALVLWMDMGN